MPRKKLTPREISTLRRALTANYRPSSIPSGHDFDEVSEIEAWIAFQGNTVCQALAEHKSRLTDSRAYNHVHELQIKLECLSPAGHIWTQQPADQSVKPKTEKQRMMDFFFPKRRGSFLSLKSWRR